MKRSVVLLAGGVFLAASVRCPAGDITARPPESPTRAAPTAPVPSSRPAVPGTVVYRSAFETARTDGWTGDKAIVVDRAKGVLGPLHNQTVRLALATLPEHRFLHLRVDLHLADTWDGSIDDGDGPDTIAVRLTGGPTLLEATFAIAAGAQSYPDCGLWAAHRGGTGAASHSPENGRALYRLAFTFPHTHRSAALEFTGRLTESRPANRTAENESWAIGSVVVSALPESPVRLDDATFARLWDALGSADPVQANGALWTLAAAGEPAVGRIEKALGLRVEKATTERIATLIRQLDDDNWRTRQKATDELKRIGRAANQQLHEALAGKPSPEVRARIEDLFSAQTGSQGNRYRAGRARWLLQVIGGKRALAIRQALPEPKPAKPPAPGLKVPIIHVWDGAVVR